MTSLREQALEERRQAIAPELAKARQIAEKAEAEHRDMTADERAVYDPIMAKGREVADAVAKYRHDQSVFQFARELSAEVGLPGIGDSGAGPMKGRRLSFKGMGAKAAAQMMPDGAKTLATSGSAVVGVDFQPDPVALGRVAQGLLDVLPIKTHTIPEYAYLRQTTRNNLAAVVPEGTVKPTSVYSVTKIEQTLAVIAHLPEGISRYWLLDTGTLEGFIDAELNYGLRVAVEAKVIADINGTSGIQTQAYATSVLASLRKGITKLEVAGLAAGAIVLTPGDWEGVELALSTVNAVEHLALPYDPAARRLWGMPIVSTVSEAAGVAHVLAADAVVVDTDSYGVIVQWSETSNQDDWSRNLIRSRCEGRFGTSVLSPLGVVKVALA
jgi:HK97 family phage major capsid protein